MVKGGHAVPRANPGVGRRAGTLETGKIANLIVTNGDPLELTTEVRYLFIKGSSRPRITSKKIYTKDI